MLLPCPIRITRRSVAPRLIALMALGIGLATISSAWGQDEPFKITIARSGKLTYQANHWGFSRVIVGNRSDTDANLLIAVSFKAIEHKLQFTWPAWLPARTSRTFWVPLRTPTITTEKSFMFSVDPLIADELDRAVLSPSLRQSFVKYLATKSWDLKQLSDLAVVDIDERGRRWFIRDKYRKFQVRHVDERLDVLFQNAGVEVYVQLFDTSVKTDDQQAAQVSLLGVDEFHPNVAFLGPFGGAEEADVARSTRASSVVEAMRLGSHLPTAVTGLQPIEMPPMFIGWQGQDTVVLARGDTEMDPAQIDALRQWILSGGRLWVMADQVDPGFLAALLRDDWTGQIVDRVALNEFTVTDGSGGDAISEFEQPVEMVRLLAPDWRVIHHVRDWPASLYRQVGLGGVWITTIGPRAWYYLAPQKHYRTGQEQPNKPTPQPTLEQLAGDWPGFNQRMTEPPLPADLLERETVKMIGHKILSRTPVGWILGLLCVVAVGFAVGFARKRRLEYSALASVVCAIVATGALLLIGSINQAQTPLTMAQTQFAQILPAQRTAVVNGVLAIYSPDKDRGPLMATSGGVVWPNLKSQGNEWLRMKWNDFDQWVWDGLQLPKGQPITVRFRQVFEFTDPVAVTAQFGPEGLAGSIKPGKFQPFEDAVLATSAGAHAVRRGASGTFTLYDQLKRREYFESKILDTVRQRRLALYRGLLNPERWRVTLKDGNRIGGLLVGRDLEKVRLLLDGTVKEIDSSQIVTTSVERPKGYPPRPMLLWWTAALGKKDLGFVLPEKQHAQHKGTALVAVPVDIRPTPTDTRVKVSGVFMPFRVVRGPTNRGSTTLYTKGTGVWESTAQPATVVIAYQLPPQVLPLKIKGGRWTIKIDASRREVETFFATDTELLPVPNSGGSGSLQVDLSALDGRIQPNERGELVLALRVGEGRVQESMWRINDMSVWVEGVVEQPGESHER